MYEQVSHSLLNEILNDLKPEIRKKDLRHFYTRLGANFYAIHSLFYLLYGERDDFKQQMLRLVETLAKQYTQRSKALKKTDIARENNHNWFLSQQWVGMALYSRGFAEDLQGLKEKIPYFLELGINLVHIMPILECPDGKSDGGYAVSNFREIDSRVGTLEDLQDVTDALSKNEILLVLDVVVNHVSEEHEWAQKAAGGDKQYQDYFYCFENREIPDNFEQSMPEVFPQAAPGNFTWNEEMQQWVMTIFHDYQWDLNYSNPAVFIEMIDIILFWANRGADIVRLDAVAFLWKKLGTNCQNQREAHLILQLMKDCCQVTAPGVLFIAEAIVAPLEIIKYFGEDAVIAKECEIAYNATFMALLWDAIATRNSKLLHQGLKSLPNKLERATWLNYARCHDDIGLGFDDSDVIAVGYEPYPHRQFLIEYFTGGYDDSFASGLAFMRNETNGDARISGTLASLTGLEKAIAANNLEEIENSQNRILLLHSLILSFGGIPLIYYGDEIGATNDWSYLDDAEKANDNRWIHRPSINWDKADNRSQPGTVEHAIFSGLKKMIAIRKETAAFADFNNRELVDLDNNRLFALIRFNHDNLTDRVLVICNFDATDQYLDLQILKQQGFGSHGQLCDLNTGLCPPKQGQKLVLAPYQFYWLTNV